MSELGRSRFHAAVAFLLVFGALTAAVVLVRQFTDDEDRRVLAHFPPTPGTAHTALDFSIAVDVASTAAPTPDLRTPYPKTTNVCDTNAATAPGTTCNLPIGGRFVVKVYLNNLGGVPSYEGFDVKLTYSGVTSKNARRAQWWPDCVFAAQFGGAGLETVGCGIGINASASTYIGLIGTAEFNCAASGTVVLEHGNGETALTQVVGNLHGETDDSVETLTINCLAATDTPTPTNTRTPTNTPQFTATPNLSPQLELDASGEVVNCHPDLVDDRIECDVPFFFGNEKGSQFTISVNTERIPQGGYGGIQTEIDLPAGLERRNPRSCPDEVVWEDAHDATCQRSVSAGHIIRHSSTNGADPLSNDTGPLVEIDVVCSGLATNLEVKLTTFSAYLDGSDDPLALKPLAAPDADDLFFNCIAPTPVMSLNAAGPRVTCNDARKPTKCTAPLEATPVTFKLLVDANIIPVVAGDDPDGYGGFASEVFFGGLTYPTPPNRTCTSEVIWPQELLCQQLLGASNAAKHHLSKSAIFAPLPTSAYVGTLVELEVQCPREGQFLVQLPVFAATPRPNGARYINAQDTPVPVATAAMQNLDTNGDTVGDGTPIPVADALLINCQILPTVTATRTVTPTATPTCVGGPCPSATPTRTPTPTVTATPSPAGSATPTRTATPTVPPPPTATFTLTPSPTSVVSETVTEELFDPGKVTTDENPPDSASATDRVETNVTTTGPGRVTITEKGVTQQAPEGFSFLGEQVNISAPRSLSAQNPLTITFVIDASLVPVGENEDTIAVFKDGMLVLNCLGPPGKASPDPCVSKRNLLVGGPTTAGDVQITVKTTRASSWNFGVGGPIPTPGRTPTPTRTGEPPFLLGDVNGDGLVNALDAWWILLLEAGTVDHLPVPRAGDANQDGRTNSADALAILQFDAGIICCLPPPQSAGAGLSPWSGFAGLRRWLLSR